jgi:hypothetical protein
MLFHVSFHSFLSTSADKQKETLSEKKWQDPVSHESSSGKIQKKKVSLHSGIWQGNRKCMQNVLFTCRQFSWLQFSLFLSLSL